MNINTLKKLIFFFALILCILSAASANAKDMLFEDNFDNGFSNNWRLNTVGGDALRLRATGGEMEITLGVNGSANENHFGTSYTAAAVAGESSWDNYIFETDAKLGEDDGRFEYSGIIFRENRVIADTSAKKSFYALVYSKYDMNNLYLTKSNLTYDSYLKKISVSDIPDFKKYGYNHYKIVCNNNNIQIFVNDREIINYKDENNCYYTGRIGFFSLSTWYGNTHVYADNVSVEKITDDALADGNDDDFKESWEACGAGPKSRNTVSVSDDNILTVGTGVGGSASSDKAQYSYFSVAANGDKDWKNYSFETDAKLGTEDDKFEYSGIMFRGDFGNELDVNSWKYYALVLSKWDNTISLTKNNPDSSLHSLKSVKISELPGFQKYGYNHYRIVCTGNNIKIFVNGDCVIDYDDNNNPCLSGKIGFFGYTMWYRDVYVYAKNIRVTAEKDTAVKALYTNGKLYIDPINSDLMNRCAFGAFYRDDIFAGGKEMLFGESIFEDYETSTSANRAKVFVWDNELRPLTKAVSVQKTEPRSKFYVSASADFGGDGTLEKPYKTLEEARDAVRFEKIAADGDIEIILLDDIYYCEKPFVLSPDDSGENGKIIFKGVDGKRPVLSAGRKIEGFKLFDSAKNIYVADCCGLKFNRLFLGERVGILAGYPDNGRYLRVSSWDNTGKTATLNEQPLITDYNGVKMFVRKVWASDILNVVNVNDRVVTFDDESKKLEFGNTNPPRIKEEAVRFENSFEMLDSKGEWYLDEENGKLYVIPFKTSDLSAVYAPVNENLISVCGLNVDDKVENIAFENLCFAHTDWEYAEENPFVDVQSQQYFKNEMYKLHPEAGVFVKNASNIDFKNVRFKDMGSTALDFYNGVSDCSVSDCAFYDIAGNGISIGVFDDDIDLTGKYNPSTERDITSDIKIENCFITRIGQLFYGSVGILAGNCRNIDILHNEISDTPWSAMSGSWGWSATNPIPQNINIKYNHIINALNKVSDGGGIYFVGNAPGSQISENYIQNLKYDLYASNYIICATYFDQGSNNITVSDNSIKASVVKHIYDEKNQNISITNSDKFIQSVSDNAGIKSYDVKKGIISKISVDKPASASSYYAEMYAPSYLTDGDANNNAMWISSGSNIKQWAQVDLGKEYYITEVDLDAPGSQDSGSHRKNFRILASNDPDFKSFDVIDTADLSWKSNEKYIRYFDLDKKYRYLRVDRTVTGQFKLNEITVYGFEED